MRKTPHLCTRLIAWLCMAFGLGLGTAHAMEPVGELDLKAAYVFNFLQFIGWPDSNGAPTNDLTLCVSSFSPLKRPLAALDGKQAAKGRALRVKLLEASALPGCHVAVLDSADVEPVLRALHALPAAHGVLTVSDTTIFYSPDIVIALAKEEGRIVFSIHSEAATKAGLTISSRLLRLAKAGR
ncbi:YfiR family protein [Acidovorax sp.]|uniref:YfiR family protein n=1 Tax=Acidovorax sp. TaxID=1872122 RepID=UPI00261CCE5D|nr:YfiR family protein [Acidovorax sp.]